MSLAITLEYVPELSAATLMQLLENPPSKTTASNLTSLELRFCNLGDEVIAQLLYHAPPNIKRLVLLCRSGTDYDLHDGTESEAATHLCPILRKFGRRLIHLEYGSGRICRELFFDQDEMESLRNDGFMTRLGSMRGSSNNGEHIDAHALQATIQRCRQRKKSKAREERVNRAIIEG